MFQRITQLQMKWRTHLVYVNWTIVFVGIIIGLFPIFLTNDEQRRGYPSGYFADLLNNSTVTTPIDSTTVLSLLSDDYVGLLGTPDVKGAEIVGPFLGMCLPAFIDLLVELYVAVSKPKSTTTTIVRLTILERFLFILGAVSNAFYFLIPIDWNVMVIFTIRFSTTTIGNILIMAPIIIFLERTTNVFSPLFTTLVLLLLTLGNVLAIFSVDIAHDTLLHNEVYSWAQTVAITCYTLILSSCCWNFLWFMYRRQQTKTPIHGTMKMDQHDPFLDFSVTHVPACHMVALCINVAITMRFSISVVESSLYFLLYTLLLFAAALVFVVEIRIRQNEVVIGLRQLDIQHYEVSFSNQPYLIFIIPITTFTPRSPLFFAWTHGC